MLDLGAGIGHSFSLLAPRETVGVDVSAEALAGQDRRTVVADMRAVPFAAGSFDAVLSVHSLEHVPDPASVVEEAARVLRPGGVAMFVTPNRLTFGRPDEVIDPYHYVELDFVQLRALCSRSFASVEVLGLFGSARYQALVDAERARLDSLLARDPLRARRAVPRVVRRRLYDAMLTRARREPPPEAAAIDASRGLLRAGLGAGVVPRRHRALPAPLTSGGEGWGLSCQSISVGYSDGSQTATSRHTYDAAAAGEREGQPPLPLSPPLSIPAHARARHRPAAATAPARHTPDTTGPQTAAERNADKPPP